MACCAHASLQKWAPHPACCYSPAGSQDTQGTTLSGTRSSTKLSAHRHISISFSSRSVSLLSFFFRPSPLCHHFSPFSDFSDRLGPLLWWMFLIISFQSREEERGGSQFRTISLTGETVSPWLPRGNGAEMDSCYKRRGGDNWWCFLAQWLHSALPSTAWLSLCRGHTLCPLLSLQSKLNATDDRLWPWKVWRCAAQLLLWQDIFSLPTLLVRSEADLPSVHTASC